MKKVITTKVTEEHDEYCISVAEKFCGQEDVYFRVPFQAKVGEIVIVTYELSALID